MPRKQSETTQLRSLRHEARTHGEAVIKLRDLSAAKLRIQYLE